MSEGQDRSIDAPAEETRSAADNRVLDPPLTAGERWELIKFKIMEDMNGRLWTVFTRTITVLGLFIALVTALGYFGIPYYVRSIFKETLELEKKSFDKLHNDITTKQQHLYFDEKIFVALLDRYLRDEQTMRSVISQEVVDIDQSETLSSTDMLEFKKTLVNGIQKMATNEMMVDEFKKLHRELLQKNATTKVLTLNGVREAFLIYPHIWALDRTLSVRILIV